jgi:hypothetical protein
MSGNIFKSGRNRILGILLVILLNQGNYTQGQTRNISDLSSDCENYLYINGESNVNQFSFKYDRTRFSDRNSSMSIDSDNIEITIPIKDFVASNPMMYGDFLVLMKEAEYPVIRVSFSKQELSGVKRSSSEACPDIRINIAGITKTYEIQCSVVRCSDYLYLSGEKNLKLSDFHLKPPQKLLGFVKVNNEIKVNFGFIITFTDGHSLSAEL